MSADEGRLTASAGEFLRDELRARGWTQRQLAHALERPEQFVSEVVNGKKIITPMAALQLGAALGTSAGYWLRLQDEHALEVLRHDEELQVALARVRGHAAALPRDRS